MLQMCILSIESFIAAATYNSQSQYISHRTHADSRGRAAPRGKMLLATLYSAPLLLLRHRRPYNSTILNPAAYNPGRSSSKKCSGSSMSPSECWLNEVIALTVDWIRLAASTAAGALVLASP